MVYRDPTIDRELAQEVVLYIANHGTLYRQMTHPILVNLARKIVQKKYLKTQAVKAWEHLVVEGISRYSREFGKISANPATRHYAAKILQSEMESDLKYIAKQMSALKKAGKPWFNG